MERIVRVLDNMYGYGFAYVKQDVETSLYRGVCSNGNSTRRTSKLSDCLRDLFRMGYIQQKASV